MLLLWWWWTVFYTLFFSVLLLLWLMLSVLLWSLLLGWFINLCLMCEFVCLVLSSKKKKSICVLCGVQFKLLFFLLMNITATAAITPQWQGSGAVSFLSPSMFLRRGTANFQRSFQNQLRSISEKDLRLFFPVRQLKGACRLHLFRVGSSFILC